MGGGGKHDWVSLSYFFLGALLGLFVATVSAVILVTSMIAGGGDIAAGAVLSGIVGAVVLATHLSEGLKRSRASALAQPSAVSSEGGPSAPPPAAPPQTPLWPSAVYFRVAAHVGLIAAVSGASGVCNGLASELFGESAAPEGFTGFTSLMNPREELFSSLLTTGVGLVVMWWHLSEARKRGQ